MLASVTRREYSASSLRYLRPFSTSFLTRATASCGTFAHFCFPLAPRPVNLKCLAAFFLVPSLSV